MPNKKKDAGRSGPEKEKRFSMFGIAAGLCAAVLAVYFCVLSYRQYRNELIRTEQEQLLVTAETVGTSLVNFVEQELAHIDLYFTYAGAGEEEEAAEAFRKSRPGLYQAIAFYDQDGNLLYQNGSMDYDGPESGALGQAVICGKKFCGDHYEMYIMRGTKSGEGSGTVILDMNLSWLYDRIVKPVKIGNGGYSVVKDQDLSIIMHHASDQIGMDAFYDRSIRYPNLDLTDLKEWLALQKEQPEGVSVIHSYRWDDPDTPPEKRIVAYTTIRLPGDSWIVNSTLPYEKLEEPLNRMFVRLTVLCVLLAGLIVLFVYIMTRSFMRAESQAKEIRYLREINEGMELLSRKDEELRHSQRLQSIGQISSHIAHEFNNYLTPVILYGGMLKEDAGISAENRELVDGILSAAGQDAELSRKLLDFSRQDTGAAYGVINFTEQVQDAIRMIGPLAPKTISFHADVAQEPVYVHGRKGMAQQILMNLFNNACHAMEEKGGTLTVSFGVDASAENPQALLSVSDTGCGIDKDSMNRIFEPFYTTRRSGKGTGLGLSVIRNMVNAADGTIRVESEPGRGTTFFLTFPCVKEQEGEAAGRKQKISCLLVLDDDRQFLKALEKKMEGKGLRVLFYEHAAAAWSALRKNPHLCDGVLVDYDMPVMNGLEFAQMVRRLNPDIRVVLMSGRDDPRFSWYCENRVIDRMVLKPDIGEFLDRI